MFIGSGTTAVCVNNFINADFVGIESNPDFVSISRERSKNEQINIQYAE